MTRFAYLIIISLLCLGCTHNNGDIGPLFGTWVLDGMTVDGDKQDIGPDDTFMQFQGKIVMTKLIDERHTMLVYSVGTWERDGDVMELDYTHYDDNNEPGTGIYRAPTWLLLETDAINSLQILSLNNRHMTLQHTTAEGAIATYNFRKTF